MKWILVLAGLVGLVAAVPAQADVGFFMTYWDGGDLKSGYGLGIKFREELIPLLSLDARASWFSFEDVGTDAFPIEVTGLVNFSMLYGGVGLGYYVFNQDFENQVGSYFLVGAELKLLPIGAFGEIKYTLLDIEKGDSKGSAEGFGANLGVSLLF